MKFRQSKRIKSYKVPAYWAFALIGGAVLVRIESIEDIEPIFSISGFIYFALLVFWGIQWITKQVRANLKLRKEKINIELKHLQSQVNPHFLFNSLNNLYGIVDKDPVVSKEYILKLSELMRYSIHEGQDGSVTIDQEVAYLKDFIYLHEIRYKKKVDVQFKEVIENGSLEILPLLLITILENAFKHGVENLRTDAFVHIKLMTLNDVMLFEVKNNFDLDAVNKQPGIGLKNMKKRLSLAYPGKHTYSASTEEDVYTAHLKIELS